MKYNLDWLTRKFDSGETIKYIFFWGHSKKENESVGNFLFSQWFPSPFTVEAVEYKTCEHWMMAHKAQLFHDHEALERILKANTPAEAKKIGREVKNFDPKVWDEKKYECVTTGNVHKFRTNKLFKDYLLNTNDRVLVEASPVDFVWGIGLSKDTHLIENPHTWKGSNLLGFALMEARDILRND
ncbi:hypothetical protein WSM22_10330 [Cytophagales bacterium WSM2-2]|nr:hypothetical protein WSM22_10330 [Cytophagales bacterium WSM2-2]